MSKKGTPRQKKSLEERFWEKVDVRGPNECWEWKGAKNRDGGYGFIKTGGGSLKLAHRMSYLMSKGNIPDGLCILHSCDNPSCVNPSHLRSGTYKENHMDSVIRGQRIYTKGEKKYSHRLTRKLVDQIREHAAAGTISCMEAAIKLGFTENTIRRTINKK